MKLNITSLGTGARTAALVHGASKSSGVWRDFARILVDEYDLTVLLLDQRGHGQSPRADSYRMEDFAQDLIDTLPTGLDFLIGQSLGGVASAWACDELKPRHFIGLDPGFEFPLSVVIPAYVLAAFGPYGSKVGQWLISLPGAIPEGSAPDTLDRVRDMFRQWDLSMMVPLTRSARRRPFPVRPPAVPSTLILAEKSLVVSPTMAAGLRSAGWDVRVKPGAVHDLHLQDPAGVISLVHDVLTRNSS
jgi:pimeloyl-ACP methyl ester carboxylesterase